MQLIMRTLALAGLLVSTTASAQDPVPAWVEQARAGAAGLGSQLQATLMEAMESGGPVAAIDVCRVRAPEIATAVSGTGLEVGRTALRIRNPDNQPDDWERTILEDFERRLVEGEDSDRIETFAIRNDGQQRWGHWMRAIPTQPMCLACHGQALNEEVSAAINRAYPDDQARGFSPVDLRGAFSVRVELGQNQTAAPRDQIPLQIR